MTIGDDQVQQTERGRRRPVWLITILIFVVVLAAAGGAVWLGRLSLAELALQSVAKSAGIERMSLSVDRLDLSGMDLSNIRLGPAGSQRIDRLEIAWSPSQLRERRVRALTVSGANLQAELGPKGQIVFDGLAALGGTRRSPGGLVFPTDLPFERITVEQSQIAIMLPDGTANVAFDAELDVSAEVVSGAVVARYAATTERGDGVGRGSASFAWAQGSAPQGEFDLAFDRLVTAKTTGTNISVSGQTDGVPDRLADLAIRATASAETIEAPAVTARNVKVTAELFGGTLAAQATGVVSDWTTELSARLQPFDLSRPAEIVLHASGNAATLAERLTGLVAQGDADISVNAEVANPSKLLAAREEIIRRPANIADHIVGQLSLAVDLSRFAVSDLVETGTAVAAMSGRWRKNVLDIDIIEPLRAAAVRLAPQLEQRLAAWIPDAQPFDVAVAAGMGSPATLRIEWADDGIDVRAVGGLELALPKGKIELAADGGATVASSGEVERFDVAALSAKFAAVPTKHGTVTGDVLVTELAVAGGIFAGVVGGDVTVVAPSIGEVAARQLKVNVDAEFDTTNRVSGVIAPGGSVEAVDVRVRGEEMLAGRTRLEFAGGEHRLALDRQSGEVSLDVRLAPGKAKLQPGARAFDFAYGAVAVTGSWPGRLVIDVRDFGTSFGDERRIGLARLRLRAVGKTSDAVVEITADGAKPTVPGWTVPTFDVSGQIIRRGPSLDGDIEAVATGGQPNLRIRGQHDLDTGQGRGEIVEAQLRFAPGTLQPGDINPAMANTLESVFATISLEGPIAWERSGALSPNLRLNIDGLAATSENIELFDGNAAIQIISAPALATPPGQRFTGQVRIGRLEPVPVDVSFQLSPGQLGAGPQLTVEQLTAQLATGSVSTDPFTLQPPNIDTDVTLRVEGADLASAAAILDGDGFGGTGRLSGAIPMMVRGQQIAITGGRLANDGPGKIFYDISVVPQSLIDRDDTVSLVLRELSNFAYDTLQVELDKALDGPGSVRLHLAGANPDVLENHPFVFNINLESDFDRLAELVLEGLTTSQGVLRALALSAEGIPGAAVLP